MSTNDSNAGDRPEAHKCRVDLAIRAIGGKWRMLVLRSLLLGQRKGQRYNGLLKSVAGISPKELTRNLRRLEAAKLVKRESAVDAGFEVELYTATAWGMRLLPAFRSLGYLGESLAEERRTSRQVSEASSNSSAVR